MGKFYVYLGIVNIVAVVTHCTPLAIMENLHSTLGC